MMWVTKFILGPMRHALGELPGQLRSHAWWYGGGIVLVALIGFSSLYLQQNTNVEVTVMFEDPVALAGFPLYFGVYTYLNGTMLIVSGVLLVFAAFSALELAPDMQKYLLVMGALLFVFGFDDVFMVHEWVGLKLAEWRQSIEPGFDRQWLETPVFAAYAVSWVAVMIAFSRQVLRTAWILLLFTFIAFGMSVVLDLWQFLEFMPQPETRPQLLVTAVVEELFKLAGTVFAAFYSVKVAYSAVGGRFSIDHETSRTSAITP